jgi:hypothetical protein
LTAQLAAVGHAKAPLRSFELKKRADAQAPALFVSDWLPFLAYF